MRNRYFARQGRKDAMRLRVPSIIGAVFGTLALASTALAVDPALNVGSASGAPGTTVQIPISIVRNSNSVTATSNLLSYDNTKFTPGTCVAQAPFSDSGASGGNDTGAGTLNGRICSNVATPDDCTVDADCTMGNLCNVNSVVSLSLADSNPMDNLPDAFVADGTFVLCPFTIAPGTAPGAYTLTNTASWSDAAGTESPATGTNGTITVLLDTDGDTIPDSTDNCDYTANVSQTDTGGIGTGSAPDGIGNACQCGDVNGDGRVLSSDSTIILRSLLTPPTATQAQPQLCNVGGSTACNSADSTIILRALLTPPTATVTQNCAPALPPP